MRETKPVSVEFFFAAGCARCAAAREALREAARSMRRVEWQEIDIVRYPQRAVEVGVVSTPAVALDGDLIFASLPTAAALRSAIQARLGRG